MNNFSPSIAAFITDAGIDVVLNASPTNQVRTRIGETLVGTLDNDPVRIEFTDKDDTFLLHIDGRSLTMRQQPKGHFFSWLNPVEPAKPVTLAELRARYAPKPAADASELPF
jgi:hypothetical protein